MTIDQLIKGKHHKGTVRSRPSMPANHRRRERFIVKILDPYSIKRVTEVFERHRWLDEHVGLTNYFVNKKQTLAGSGVYHEFVFFEKSHAMLFKLTWGGK